MQTGFKKSNRTKQQYLTPPLPASSFSLEAISLNCFLYYFFSLFTDNVYNITLLFHSVHIDYLLALCDINLMLTYFPVFLSKYNLAYHICFVTI